MDYVLWDFVDREEQLTDLWKVAHQERMLPIVFVAGEEGMGKTYLLEEFRQECQRRQVAQAGVDFNEKGLGEEYFNIILKVASQLGQQHLDKVLRAIEHIRQTGLKKLAAETSSAGAPAEAGGAGEAPAGVSTGGETTAAAPGVTIHNEATLEIGNIARGANVAVNPIFNALYTDDPLVKDWAKTELTAVFLKELADFTAQQRLVLLFDHWEAASTGAARWVNENLVDWVLAQPPPQVVLYLASPEFPKIEKARGRAWAARLAEFTQEVAHQFWVERWKLPEEFFESAWENSGGEPRLLFWAARRRKRELDNQAGGVYTG
jgi:hypothetical protein